MDASREQTRRRALVDAYRRDSADARRMGELLARQEGIEAAADVAVKAARDAGGPVDGDSVTVGGDVVARYYQGEPVPVIARLARRKMDLPMRLQMLGLLWGADPVAADDSLPWSRAIAPLRHDARDLRRARTILREVHDDYAAEMAVWRPAEGTKRAWGTPVRPDEIKVPLDVWRKGWHLCLHRHELAWLLARNLPNYKRDPNGKRLRAAMGERYIGLSKHIEGISLARQIDISVSAPLWLATRLLKQLSKRDYPGGNWPPWQLNDDELLIDALRTEISGDPTILLRTASRGDPEGGRHIECRRTEFDPPDDREPNLIDEPWKAYRWKLHGDWGWQVDSYPDSHCRIERSAGGDRVRVKRGGTWSNWWPLMALADLPVSPPTD